MASLLGSDLTFNQGSELLSRLARAGLSAEQAKRLLSDETIASQWVKVFPVSATVSNDLPTFKVTVNYDIPFEKMVADGKYDWVNPEIKASRDTDAPADNFKLTAKGQQEIDILLVHLNRDATSKEAEAELEKRGLRPATIEELLALGAAQPELQWDFPIVASGSHCLLRGSECVPALDRNENERELILESCERWHKHNCRFAAVRK